MKIDQFVESNGITATTHSAGVPLFNLVDSLKLLESCARQRVGILGVEGFTLSEKGLRPEMDWIVDFSELADATDFVSESVRITRNFLTSSKATERLVFEFVLKDTEH